MQTPDDYARRLAAFADRGVAAVRAHLDRLHAEQRTLEADMGIDAVGMISIRTPFEWGIAHDRYRRLIDRAHAFARWCDMEFEGVPDLTEPAWVEAVQDDPEGAEFLAANRALFVTEGNGWPSE